ncbi:hypothetical protein EYC87_19265 [Halieaceae bacterium IMCC8485]|uniref:DNA phosphorothioation-associated protein 4 n=1 Tax=Candidatus Seongchinamella marina TaxID=2518990 RepID=A0ABT3T0C9_9GAMM|nr:hypothetical protein [Candidatus Seongchinamella marina]MCX2975715.1 hypothetical protein [Candidatus Seongchinamella marina]
MPEERKKDWRNINVRRNRKYEPIVDKLCTRKGEHSKRPIFEYNKDLMVFAGVLGYAKAVQEDLESDSIQITLGTYASDEKDGFIYLIGLLENKSVDCLKDDNIGSAVNTFEKYCNGGLSLISNWLEDSPGDIEGVDTLVQNLFDELVANQKNADDDPRNTVVDF